MSLSAFSLIAGFAVAAPAAAPPKVVAFGWEFSRKSVRDLPAVVDSLDRAPIDGIGVYLNEPQADGTTLSTHNTMHGTWLRETLEPLVPVARELTAHRSMRESFIGTFRAPRARIAWDDDASWARVASNMALAAWFAREGGFRGISMDPEDYPRSAQFRRRPDEPPFETLAELARRRGREVFSGVFSEFPDITVLSFWFLSLDQRSFGEGDLAADARETGDLWPAFVDGILDVLPPEARLLDGDEFSYWFDSGRGDYYRAANAIHRRLPALLSPENREKYAAQVGAAFGTYLDMYTDPEGRHWWNGEKPDVPAARHVERKISQAADAGDGYIWFWGEKNCWADWGADGPDPGRGISPRPWREALPGLAEAILAVKDPEAFAAQKMSCAPPETAAIPLSAFDPWQHDKSRKGRLWLDETFGEGDSSSLAAEGCEDGAYSCILDKPLVAGDRLLVRVSMHGEGGCARFAWRRTPDKWDWTRLASVVLRFGPPDAAGWRHAEAVVRFPESAVGCGLILGARQTRGQICHFDNVEILPLALGGANP
ncbi:MAG: hypothetical protein IJ783_07965 [Kiritimatiellae bacterium]|nr:hypothetical protein [Kiritimatiellia bacterium]